MPRSPQMSKARRQGGPQASRTPPHTQPHGFHLTLATSSGTGSAEPPDPGWALSEQWGAVRAAESPAGSALLGGRGGGTESWEALKDQTQPSRSPRYCCAERSRREQGGVWGGAAAPEGEEPEREARRRGPGWQWATSPQCLGTDASAGHTQDEGQRAGHTGTNVQDSSRGQARPSKTQSREVQTLT